MKDVAKRVWLRIVRNSHIYAINCCLSQRLQVKHFFQKTHFQTQYYIIAYNSLWRSINLKHTKIENASNSNDCFQQVALDYLKSKDVKILKTFTFNDSRMIKFRQRDYYETELSKIKRQIDVEAMRFKKAQFFANLSKRDLAISRLREKELSVSISSVISRDWFTNWNEILNDDSWSRNNFWRWSSNDEVWLVTNSTEITA